MQKYNIKTNIPKYDSMSLQIPYNQCEIIDHELIQEYVKYFPKINKYSQVLEKPKAITITKFKGITIRILFNETNIGFKSKYQKTPIRQRNIVLTLSAKLLKEKYFEGINKNNIKDLYNEFMKFEIFKCTYKTFLQSLPTDIDICKDRYVTSSEQFLKSIISLQEQTEKNKLYTKQYNKILNLGLQFNHRERATPTKPYIKLYFKQYDLQSKSKEFAKEYLKNYKSEIKNLIRVEATIRNYQHKKRLVKKLILPEFKTLEELLNISDSDKNKFLIESINSYIIKSVRVKTEGLTPKDQIITQFIEQLILNKYDYNQIIGLSQYIVLKNKESERKQIINTKKLLTKLYDKIIHENDQLRTQSIENKSIQEFMNWLGINKLA